MINQPAIDKIAYRNRKPKTRMERGLYNGYNSLPGEVLLISRYGRVTSDKRTLYGAQTVYHRGFSKPNYPVPAIRNERTYMLNEIAAYPSMGQYDFQDICRFGLTD